MAGTNPAVVAVFARALTTFSQTSIYVVACLLIESGPVPAYSHALERRSGPRNLHKYRVLARAPPRMVCRGRSAP